MVPNITDSVYLAPCDALTFKALYSAFTSPQDITGEFTASPGEYMRRVDPNCYPDESKSSISRDGIIMVLHDIWTKQDYAGLVELIDFAEDNNFNIGEGPFDLINVAPLYPVMLDMKWTMEVNLELTSTKGLYLLGMDIGDLIDKQLTGFRGHLLLSYILLAGRVDGEIGNIKLGILEDLVDKNPNNPFMLSVFHRFTDGIQTKAITILNDDFPTADIIYDDGYRTWGSSPYNVMFCVIVGILEGK